MKTAKREIREPMDAQQTSPSFEVNEPLLTQNQAAMLLHIEPRTLESWRQHRVGPRYIRYSRRCVRYRIEDIQHWLAEQTVQTRQEPSTRYA
jgi:hypothetical protein